MIKSIDELSLEEMQNLGIREILWYSAIGRGEYELVRQIENLGFNTAVKEFNLHTHEDGVHVDWEKFSSSFYVPKAIQSTFIEPNRGKLFAGDDINAFIGYELLGGEYDKDLVSKIREEGKELPLEKLKEPSWRQEAKRYAKHLIEVQIKTLYLPQAKVAEGYEQPVDVILATYLQDVT